MHTGVKLVLSDSINRPIILSLSDSNTIRDALDCAVWMPLKNSSTVAQYVIDSFSIVDVGSGSYINLISYMCISLLSTSTVRSACLLI
jgi:hypothetical protein